MGIYQTYILPRLINLVMQNRAAREERARFLPLASGTVLEVGIGSGLNIPFYSPDVKRLYGVDPSPELRKMAQKRARATPFPITFVEGSAEEIPVDDESFDAVVMTWTLCSVRDPLKALGEIKRVLRPDGRLIFVEHGRSPEPGVGA
jgi:ubiquinone/menaquinone biosynthesis C-methylase UbiE